MDPGYLEILAFENIFMPFMKAFKNNFMLHIKDFVLSSLNLFILANIQMFHNA